MSGTGINPINVISALNKAVGSQAKPATETTTSDFGDLLGQAINHLAETENKADTLINKLAAGEDVELHQVMLAMQEADITFQVALQTRNKLIDAYQEIMRMQV